MSARTTSRRHSSLAQDIARIFDFAGAMDACLTLYRRRAPFIADADALKSDWEAVGRDFRRAADQFEREHPMVR